MDQNEQAAKIVQLEAEVDFLRDIVRAIIARFPLDIDADAPLKNAIKSFNEASQKLPEPQQSARMKAWRNFRYEQILRPRG